MFKSIMQKTCLIIAALAAVEMFSLSCTFTASENAVTSSSSQKIAVTGVTVSGNSTVAAGKTIMLTAVVTPANAENSAITWNITDGTAYASITGGGIFTGKAAGTVKVTASAGGVTSSVKTITVTAASQTAGGTGEGATGLYADASLTYAVQSDVDSGTKPDFALKSWQSSSVAVSSGILTSTVAAGAGWSGFTFGQVPSSADTGSYYDLSGVTSLKFDVKSADITTSALSLIIQNLAAANLVDSIALSSYGVSDITSWTTVTVPLNSTVKNAQILAFALVTGTAEGTSVSVRNIAFTDASGSNVDITTHIVYTAATAPYDGMTCVFADEFDTGTVPSTRNWKYEILNAYTYNGEHQAYVQNSANAYVSDGTLKIKAIKDSSGNWTSTRLNSTGTWKYGYIEASLKLPSSNGTWPAFWMLGSDIGTNPWPACGEIDIMEHAPSTTGLNVVYSTLHSSGHYGGNGKSIGKTTIATAASAFHTYGVKWTSGEITAYYDGVKQGSYVSDGTSANWPYDSSFYMLLNLAIGGDLGGTIDSSMTSAVFEIDYVRVYQ